MPRAAAAAGHSLPMPAQDCMTDGMREYVEAGR